MPTMPSSKDLKVLFAHVAYEFTAPFEARNTGMSFETVRSFAELEAKITDAGAAAIEKVWSQGGAKGFLERAG